MKVGMRRRPAAGKRRVEALPLPRSEGQSLGVGQLEEEELFYLLTRGLPEPLARNLLTYGFVEQIINKIGIEGIKSDLDAAVLNRLNVKLDV